MTYLSLILILFCWFSGALSSYLISPCKVGDLICIENALNAVLPQILGGIPELGVESSDPQYNEIIEGDLPTLKFTLYNNTTTGYKNCIISNLKMNDDVTSIHCYANCTNLTVRGQYVINGYLITLPIEGKGSYQFFAEKYFLDFDLEMKKILGTDGKTHLSIKNFKVKATPVNVTYDLKNLFNGQKDLADVAHKYAVENWKEVAEFIQDPIWDVSLKKVTVNVNKYLENLALEDILLQKDY